MKYYCVSRHAGAIDWLLSAGIRVDEILPHLDISIIKKGDIVIGTLPVQLAEQVCSRGGRYFALTINIPQELRGQELTPERMNRYGACITEFKIQRVTPEDPLCRSSPPQATENE